MKLIWRQTGYYMTRKTTISATIITTAISTLKQNHSIPLIILNASINNQHVFHHGKTWSLSYRHYSSLTIWISRSSLFSMFYSLLFFYFREMRWNRNITFLKKCRVPFGQVKFLGFLRRGSPPASSLKGAGGLCMKGLTLFSISAFRCSFITLIFV